MRILHVIPYYEPAFVYGGPTRCVPQLCRALVRAGADVSVLTTDANGMEKLDVPIGSPVVVGGVQVFYYPRRSPLWTFWSPELGDGLRSMVDGYDLIHINGIWSYPAEIAATVAQRRGIPYVASPHGSLMPRQFRYKAYKKVPYFYLRARKHLQSSAAIHCTSEIESVGLARWGLDQGAFVVPNAIDVAEFASLPARGDVRRRLGIGNEVTLLLFFARLHPNKGIELLLESFSKVARTNASVHLAIVGPDEGGYATSIPDWARERGLRERIHVPGELTGRDRLSALSDADLFVLLSESENFSMSVAEAMACGIPVVVTPGVGISNDVQGWNAGIVVQHDSDAVARDIAELLDKPAVLKDMGTRGIALVQAQYASDAVAASMLSTYEKVVRPSSSEAID